MKIKNFEKIVDKYLDVYLEIPDSEEFYHIIKGSELIYENKRYIIHKEKELLCLYDSKIYFKNQYDYEALEAFIVLNKIC